VRVAALDLGTNSTRLLVADVDCGRVRTLVRRLTITRLGEGVDTAGRLAPAATGRVRACLEGYADEIRALRAERTLAIATSALRDARDGPEFLEEIETSFGFATRLLTGEDEAALTLRGVTAGREVADGTLIVDIGGGSTELVVADGSAIRFATSLQLGCVRLTERFLLSDPPRPSELDACAAYVRSALPRLDCNAAIGVAGTVTTLAALDLGLVAHDPERTHGHRLAVEAVEHQLTRLAGLPLRDRERVPALDPGRAPVIVAGIVILRETLLGYGLDEIETSERDILDGAALAAAELPTVAQTGRAARP
jgi:exopolyphosphatase/guanosine-5'-triphosphate,3'-diphosphate pyrophosphatase